MKFPVYQDKSIQKVILIHDKEQTLLWGSVAEEPIWPKDQRQKKLETVRHPAQNTENRSSVLMKFPVYQDKSIQKVILIHDKEQTLLWGSGAEEPIWSKDQRQKKLEAVRHDHFKATESDAMAKGASVEYKEGGKGSASQSREREKQARGAG